MDIPSDRKYTEDHEWLRLVGGRAQVGITEFAAEQLGDVVYVELPAVGAALAAAAPFGVVESVKAASDLYSPVSGAVVEVNEALAAAPELVNEDPYGEGWMIEVALDDPAELDGLLDAADYERLVTGAE